MLSVLKSVIISCFFMYSLAHTSLVDTALIAQGLGVQLSLPYQYSSLYSQQQFKHMHKDLLEKPQEVLKVIIQHCWPYINQSGPSLSLPLFQQVTEYNPLSFLGECVGNDCMLNRFRYSLRKDFEDEVVQKIKDSYPHKEQELVYVSFGSGGLFSDCVILTRLINAGYKNIKIHFIDKQYALYNAVVKDYGSPCPKHLDEAYKEIEWSMHAYTYALRQLLEWLTKCAEAPVAIALYASVDDYMACGKHYQESCDILVGMDYFLEMPGMHSCQDFRKLALYATKQRGLICSCVEFGTIALSHGYGFPDRVTVTNILLKRKNVSYVSTYTAEELEKYDGFIQELFEELSSSTIRESELNSSTCFSQLFSAVGTTRDYTAKADMHY